MGDGKGECDACVFMPACIHLCSLCNLTRIAGDYIQKHARGHFLPLVQLGAVQLVQMLPFK